MIDIRCPKCGRKLMEIKGQAQVNIKCAKCKSIVIIDTSKNKSDIRLPN